CRMLLEWFGERFEAMAADCFRRKQDFELGLALVRLNPARYSAEVAKLLPAHVPRAGLWQAQTILPALGALAVDPYADALINDEHYADAGKLVLTQIAKHGGERAKPALLKVLENSKSPMIRAAALEHLLAMKDPALHETLETAIEKGMDGEPRDAARFAVLAA